MRKLIYPTLIALFACSPMLMAEDVKQPETYKRSFDDDLTKQSVDELYSRLSVNVQRFFLVKRYGRPDLAGDPYFADTKGIFAELMRRNLVVKKELVLADDIEKLDYKKFLKYLEVMGAERGELSYREMMGIGCEFMVRDFQINEAVKVVSYLPPDEMKAFEKFIETGVIPEKPRKKKKLPLGAHLQAACENAYAVLSYVEKEEGENRYSFIIDPKSVDKQKLEAVHSAIQSLVKSGVLIEQKFKVDAPSVDKPDMKTSGILDSILESLAHRYGALVAREIFLGGIETRLKFQNLEKEPEEVVFTVRLPKDEMKKLTSIKAYKAIPNAPEAQKEKNN